MMVAEAISEGRFVDALALATNAGLGAVSPFSATQALQSCERVRVTLAADAEMLKPVLSEVAETVDGRSLSTVMIEDLDGTTQRTSTRGASGTLVGIPQAVTAARIAALDARRTPARKRRVISDSCCIGVG